MEKEAHPNQRLLSELTVSEFEDIAGLKKERERLEKAIENYKELASQSKDILAVSKQVFSNAKHLTATSTPFEIETQEAWKKFSDGVYEALSSDKLKVILSIATIEQ